MARFGLGRTPLGIVVNIVLLMVATAEAIGRSSDRKLHYTDAHAELHQALFESAYSHLPDFEVAVPEFVDEMGNHVSHDLRHRVRRSAESEKTIIGVTTHGENFRVELAANEQLLRPSFGVTRITGSATETEKKQDVVDVVGTDCHYTGRMVSHGDLKTALSLCSGASGVLRSQEEDFFIEPVPEGLGHAFPSPMRPHVVYKRNRGKKRENHYCGDARTHPMPVSRYTDVQYRYLSDGSFVISPLNGSAISSSNSRRLDASSPRLRRSVRLRNRKVVETLVVADREMLKKHETDRIDVATYILTVMNMVNVLYRDGSLDTEIDISLTELVLLEDDQELHIGHRASNSLANFCNWQARRNATTGRRPDHAILLTGINICADKDEPCDTLGLAEVGGMCNEQESCTINEDTGLGLAFTVAHETGHSLGMTHDGYGNTCSQRNGHIMASTINTLNGVFTWSSCSRKALEEFLKTDQSRCLDDAERLYSGNEFDLPRELPGQLYSADEQCKLQFGRDRSLCGSIYQTDKDYICKSLWCGKPSGECETKHLPASDGTPCGQHKWCRRGRCVPFGSGGPNPVNGGWSAYGPWSECSRTCGVGVLVRTRRCDSPEPMFGGRHCDGDDAAYRLCNTFECPPTALDYRFEQCAEYDSKPYRFQYFSWIPYTQYWKYGANRCELLCQAEGYKFFDRLSPRVKDGTSCDDETNDVCIAGTCEPVGCDGVLHSGTAADLCGVCGGDNSTCRRVKGTFSDKMGSSEYYFVAKIPAGAATIKVWEEDCCPHAYIAVKPASNKSRYYLNGDWAVDMQGEKKFSGSKWKYERKFSMPETLATKGPINEAVIIEVLVVDKNPGVSYSYYLPEIDNALPYDVVVGGRSTAAYSWHEELTECTRSCAGGIQRSVITCVENGVHLSDDSLCDQPRPESQTYKCNTRPCPARWRTGEWTACSNTCGSGVRTRAVFCNQVSVAGDRLVSDDLCSKSDEPERNITCETQECGTWKPGRWSKCSESCGRGQRTRLILCKAGSVILPVEDCEGEKRPKTKRGCRLAKCRREYQWLILAWGECSVTCGEGVQRRRVRCSRKMRQGGFRAAKKKRCKGKKKPKISTRLRCATEACPTSTTTEFTARNADAPASRASSTVFIPTRAHLIEMPDPTWVAGPWRKCSASCGGGTQSRRARCLSGESEVHECAPVEKPSEMRACNERPCRSTVASDESCVDRFPWCYLVPYHGTCGHHFFGAQCCKSCEDG